MLNAAQLYFLENDIQFVWETASIPNLVAEGYVEGGGYLNNSSFVTNVTPARICASASGKSKLTFYDATAEEIVNSRNDINIGNTPCGEENKVVPF